jgi:uncharacterized membrane protein
MADIPVTPDADTARQWAADELAKASYQDHGPSLMQRIQEWISHVLSSIFESGPGFGSVTSILAIVVVVLVVVAVVYAVVGPIRRGRKAAREGAVFEDDVRTSAQMRESSERAAARGEWSLATLERYRAVIRSLEERDLIEQRAGMTAHEAAGETARRFPDVRSLVTHASEIFDGVRYGRREAASREYETMTSLDRALAGRSILTAAAS